MRHRDGEYYSILSSGADKPKPQRLPKEFKPTGNAPIINVTLTNANWAAIYDSAPETGPGLAGMYDTRIYLLGMGSKVMSGASVAFAWLSRAMNQLPSPQGKGGALVFQGFSWLATGIGRIMKYEEDYYCELNEGKGG